MRAQACDTYLDQHLGEQVLEVIRHERLLGEAQRLCLHDLEQLVHGGRGEGDAPVHKGEQAGAQRIDIRRPAPALAGHAQCCQM